MTDAIAFEPAAEADFERLLELRIQVLRPHLERVGRFDPDRARRYFREGYDPTHLRLILVDNRFAGCVALKPDRDGLVLEHFYLADAFQGLGIGGAVLRRLLAEADAAGRPVRLGVLKGSPAARLYERHGFLWTYAEPYDDFYLRRPGGATAEAELDQLDQSRMVHHLPETNQPIDRGMAQVNLYDAKTHLSALVDRAAAGEEIVIAKNGTPLARLVPVEKPKARRVPANVIQVTYIADDFDEVDPEIVALFEGRD